MVVDITHEIKRFIVIGINGIVIIKMLKIELLDICTGMKYNLFLKPAHVLGRTI